jgi:hypothetical protein
LSSQQPRAAPFQPYTSPEIDVRVAVGQMSCSRNVRENVSKMAAMMMKLSAGGADIVAFPELAVTGRAEEDVQRAGDKELAEALALIRELARSRSICTVFGMPHRENGKTTNAAFVVGSDGSVMTRYDQLAVDRPHLFQPGATASSMWFRLNGVPAVVPSGTRACGARSRSLRRSPERICMFISPTIRLPAATLRFAACNYGRIWRPGELSPLR